MSAVGMAEPPAVPAEAPAQPRPKRLRMPLAAKLAAALIGLVTLVLLVNGAINLWLSYDEAKSSAVSVQQEKAQAAAERIGQFVAEIENQMGWTTRAEWRRVPLEQQRYDFIRLLRQAPAITEISYLDGSGKEQLKVSRLEPDAVGSETDFSKEPKFARAVGEKSWFGPVYFRRGSEPYMTIAVAHAGRNPGVTVAEVNLKLIWDVITAIKIGEKGLAFVADSKGRLIAHPDLSLVLRDTDLSRLPQVANAVAGAPGKASAAEIVTAQDGSRVLSAHAPITRLGWLVFVQLPVGEALAPAYTSLWQTAALLALGLLLATVAGTYLSRRMVVPIRELQTGAERLGAGDLSQRIAIRTGDEIETLAERFNGMAARIQESYETLERRVEERTRDLNETLQQQTATADVLQVISRSAFDLQKVLDTLIDTGVRLCRGTRGIIFLRRGEMLDAAAFSTAVTDDLRKLLREKPLAVDMSSRSGRAVVTRSVVHFSASDDDGGIERQDTHQAAGYKSYLAVPLVTKEEAIGVFGVSRNDPGGFTPRQIELVQTFADQAVIAIENARLFEEVQARTREVQEALEFQTATSEILNVISRSPTDSQPVFDAIVESAVRLCGAAFCNVQLYYGEQMHVQAVHNFTPEALAQFRAMYPRRPDKKQVAGRAVLAGTTVYVPDLLEDPDFPRQMALAGGWRAIFAVPMMRQGKPLGAIAVSRAEPDSFTDRHMRLLQTFADQAVIAIENARLFEEVQARTRELTESLEYQTATSEVLGVISRSPNDLGPVLDSIVGTAVHLCAADTARVWMLSGDVFNLAAAHPDTDPARIAYLRERPLPTGRGSLAGRAVLEGLPIHVADIREVTDLHTTDQAHTGHLRTMLVVPLVRKGQPIGVISLSRTHVELFSDRQVELVTTFADQAVIAIENARLFEEVQARTAELTESLEYQTATSEVLGVISRSPDQLQPVLDAIVAIAARICQATIGEVALAQGGRLRVAASVGEMARFSGDVGIDRGTVMGRSILDGLPVHCDDLLNAGDEFPSGQRMAAQLGHRTILAVPLMRGGGAIGTILLRRATVQPFSDKQIALLKVFADQAVIAINNVGLFDEVQARTRELSVSLEQQTATSDVLQAISRSTFDLETVLDTLVKTAARLCKASPAQIYRRDGEVYRSAALYEHQNEAYAEIERRGEIRAGPGTLIGRVALTGAVVQITDAWTDPDYEAKDDARLGNVRSMLGVPLMRGDEIVGAFALARQVAEPFTKKEVELVTTFADQAFIAIENARLFEDVQSRTRELTEALEYQTATSDVLNVISRSPNNLQPVLDEIVATAARLCGADRSMIRLREGATYPVTADFGFDADQRAQLLRYPNSPGRGTIWGRAVLDGCAVHLADIEAEAEFERRDAWSMTGGRSGVGVPLISDGPIVGTLTVTRETAGGFLPGQIRLLSTFADQAVIAIKNARLFGEVQARTAELQASLDDLRKAQDRLVQSEKLASLGQLTAGIAHEIKNPLNFVNNFSALSGELIDELREVLDKAALDGKTSEDALELMDMLKGNLDKVVQHGKRADSIVKNMLLHSREGSGERRAADVNAIVEESMNLAYHGARAEKPGFNIALEKDLDPAAGEADLFPQEVTRVLLNLFSNGFYAATKRKAEMDGSFEPTMRAATRNLGDHVEIRIRDNGTGIPDEVRAKMFNPFFTTKPAGEGTGLGLSLSHDIIVKQHGGTMEVATVPGEFTEFTIVLPRAAAAAAARGGA